MSDQNCIHCGEPVKYSCEPEHGEPGEETPNGPAHYRCIDKARIEELETAIKGVVADYMCGECGEACLVFCNKKPCHRNSKLCDEVEKLLNMVWPEFVAREFPATNGGSVGND